MCRSGRRRRTGRRTAPENRSCAPGRSGRSERRPSSPVPTTPTSVPGARTRRNALRRRGARPPSRRTDDSGRSRRRDKRSTSADRCNADKILRSGAARRLSHLLPKLNRWRGNGKRKTGTTGMSIGSRGRYSAGPRGGGSSAPPECRARGLRFSGRKPPGASMTQGCARRMDLETNPYDFVGI